MGEKRGILAHGPIASGDYSVIKGAFIARWLRARAQRARGAHRAAAAGSRAWVG